MTPQQANLRALLYVGGAMLNAASGLDSLNTGHLTVKDVIAIILAGVLAYRAFIDSSHADAKAASASDSTTNPTTDPKGQDQ